MAVVIILEQLDGVEGQLVLARVMALDGNGGTATVPDWVRARSAAV